MEEAKRFLRYVMPGMAFLIQFAVVYILEPPKFILCRNFKEISEIGIALSAILVAGVIGYMASNLYYVLHWKVYMNLGRKLDYKHIVSETIPTKDLQKYRFEYTCSNQSEAWALLNVYWNVEGDKEFPKVQDANASTANILHSIGTTIILLLIGSVLGAIYLCAKETIIIGYTIINIVIVTILCWNYQIVAKMLQQLYLNTYRSIKHSPVA